MREIAIGKWMVAPGRPSYIIAEAGANHDRDYGVARELIDVAVASGANAVKFQTYSAETLYSRFAPRLKEMSQFDRSPQGETPFDMIKRLELPRDWQPKLAEYAASRGIDFLSTPFDLDAAEELAAIGVKAFKIASYEIGYYALLKKCASYGRPVIVSTGNAELWEVEKAVEAVRESGNDDIILLHCVSQYPAAIADVNLRAMQTLAQAFDLPAGFSDHTMGLTCAVLAVGLGGTCFEKHFTLSRKRKGPDHPSSAEPNELKDYVQAIRDAETALGSPIKRVQKSEDENHRLGKRSLHALVDIPKGTVIRSEMLTVKRPALGIHPYLEQVVLGRKAARAIKADEWITWEMI